MMVGIDISTSNRSSSPARPPSANPKSRSSLPNGLAVKLSPWTRCRCIVDSTSARPSRRPPTAPVWPHHLIDICDLTESFDVAQFIRLAQKAVEEIQARGRVPIFCGGTGLYFKAFLSGLGEAPSANPELRARLEAMPFEALLRELRERDPAAYEKIDKQNPRRVIRAVEVIRLTGKKFSQQRAEWKAQSAVPAIKSNFYCFTRAACGFAGAHQRPRGRDVRARPGGRDA